MAGIVAQDINGQCPFGYTPLSGGLCGTSLISYNLPNTINASPITINNPVTASNNSTPPVVNSFVLPTWAIVLISVAIAFIIGYLIFKK